MQAQLHSPLAIRNSIPLGQCFQEPGVTDIRPTGRRDKHDIAIACHLLSLCHSLTEKSSTEAATAPKAVLRVPDSYRASYCLFCTSFNSLWLPNPIHEVINKVSLANELAMHPGRNRNRSYSPTYDWFPIRGMWGIQYLRIQDLPVWELAGLAGCFNVQG